MRDLKSILNEAIQTAVAELALTGNPFTSSEVAARVFESLEPDKRDALALQSLTALARRIMRGRKPLDDRQACLDLPEFDLIPKLVKVKRSWIELRAMTYGQYQDYIQGVKERIYGARKVNGHDMVMLGELRRLGKTVKPFIENRDTPMGTAIDLYQRKTPGTGAKTKVAL